MFDLSEGDSGAAPPQRVGSPVARPAMTTVDFRHTGYDLRARFAGLNHNAWGHMLQARKQGCENQALETSP